MRTFFALLFLASLVHITGCSALLIEKLSTETYDGDAKEPFVTERPIGVDNGRTGITKQLFIHNPLPFAIEAKITCSSMYNDDPTILVRPRTSKFFMIGANHNQEHDQSCFLTNYTVIYPVFQ